MTNQKWLPRSTALNRVSPPKSALKARRHDKLEKKSNVNTNGNESLKRQIRWGENKLHTFSVDKPFDPWPFESQGYTEEVTENLWQKTRLRDIDIRRVAETDWLDYVKDHSYIYSQDPPKDCPACDHDIEKYDRVFDCKHCHKAFHRECIFNFLEVTGRCFWCDNRLGPRWPEYNEHVPNAKPKWKETIDPAFQVPDERAGWFTLPFKRRTWRDESDPEEREVQRAEDLSMREAIAKEIEWKALKNKFFDKDLCLKQILGQGDCLFDAIERQVYGYVTGEKVVRKKIVEYIAAAATKDDFYVKLITQQGASLENYLEDKSKKAWGDKIEIYAAAEMYQLHVSVYDRSTKIIATYGEIWKFKPERILLLYSFDMEHYDAIGTSYGYASIFENQPKLNEIEDRMISQLKENGPSEQVLQYRRELIEKDPPQVVNQSEIQIN